MRPMVSAELKPMCLSEGRTGGGMVGLSQRIMLPWCSDGTPTSLAHSLLACSTAQNKLCFKISYTPNCSNYPKLGSKTVQ